jgi:D-inositol-3-phosphate glycosyltransferase
VGLISMHSSPLATLGLKDAGGMNLYVSHLAEGLAERGVQVDIFTRRTDRHSPDTITTPSAVRIVNLTAGPKRPLPKSILPLHVPAFADALHRFSADQRTPYEVLHSHYWLSGLAALQARASDSPPMVHMFHTLSRVKQFYFGAPDPADTILRFDGERQVIEAADAIVGATPDELPLMEKLYGRVPAQYAVVPPGVDTDLFRPLDRAQSRSELGIDADRVILFVGRVDRIKGIDTLFRSVAAYVQSTPRRVRLLVVGGATEAADGEMARFRKLATGLGIGSIVDFVGAVPSNRLPLYYSAADICAVPSAYESFGMVATEAMACQTPVVAFRVGGLAYTVKDGQTGFLASPGITSEFTDKLRVALDSDSLDTMGRQARLSVQRFAWDSIVDRTLDVYDRVRETSRCSPRACGGD